MAEKLDSNVADSHKVADGDEFRWKQLTQQGNQAFNDGEHELASDVYAKALAEALRLLDRALQGLDIEAVPILVISYHNAAENWQALGQADKTVQHYRAAYDRILDIAESESAPLPARAACVRNLSHAMSPLISTLTETGGSEQTIAQLVTRARRAALDLPDPSPEQTRH